MTVDGLVLSCYMGVANTALGSSFNSVRLVPKYVLSANVLKHTSSFGTFFFMSDFCANLTRFPFLA